MKRSLLAIALIALLSVFVACESDDNNDTNQVTSQEIPQIVAAAQSGSWVVASYIEDGVNETSDFAGYTFDFMSNGTVVATLNSETTEGTWSVTDDSNSSSSDDDVDFNISFPVPDTSVLDELNDDWDILSYSSTQIRLRDVSGGNGTTDDLVLERS